MTIDFPSPVSLKFDLARRLFTEKLMKGVFIDEVTVDQWSDKEVYWKVSYYSEDATLPPVNQYPNVKLESLFRQHLPQGSIFVKLGTTYSPCSSRWCCWYNSEKQRDEQRSKKQRIWSTLKSLVKCCHTTQTHPAKSETSNLKVQLDDDTFIHPSQFLNQRPKKLWLDDVDITRRVCGKTRLCKKSLSEVLKKLYPESKEMHATVKEKDRSSIQDQYVKFVSAGLQSQDEPKSRQKSESTIPSLVAVPPPVDFSRNLLLSKLRDQRVYKLVSDYLSVEFGRGTTMRSKYKISTIRSVPIQSVEIQIQSEGLPLDDLYQLFLDYNKSYGMSSTASLRMLQQIRLSLVR